jgi:hypothetical protein
MASAQITQKRVVESCCPKSTKHAVFEALIIAHFNARQSGQCVSVQSGYMAYVPACSIGNLLLVRLSARSLALPSRPTGPDRPVSPRMAVRRRLSTVSK